MKWAPFKHQGTTYDLSHLHGFSYELVVPPKGEKPEQRYHLNVAFSLHCFTRSPKSGEIIPADLAYSDRRETRIFDFDRHALSMRLPEIVRNLGRYKCHHDKHGNFYVFEVQNENGTTSYYSVFFTVSRSGSIPGLNLFITTAHMRPKPPFTTNPKPIRFSVIVHNKWHGKPVKPAP